MYRNSEYSVALYRRFLMRAFAFGAVAALTLVMASSAASAVELVPSVGLTRTVDGDEAKGQVGLALRGDIVRNLLQTEIGASYRKEVLSDGTELHMWPVTASLWLTPIRSFYAGAGVGWYQTTYNYPSALVLSDDTTQEFGVHLGGGMKVPLASTVALDLGGRYVMLQDQETKLIPSSFNPSFWSLSIGLAFRL